MIGHDGSIARVPRFQLGSLYATPDLLEAVQEADIRWALVRQATCDWGEVCDADKSANDRALIEGTRLLSAFRSASGTKFWIITEADRSATTVLLPEEY